MIAFRYTKTDGAEYLSHLDLLRHIYRTMRRAGVTVAMSGGYHAHARIFLNNPLGVGVRSVAEYGAFDGRCDGDFKQLFNAYAPEGVKCVGFREVAQNPNYANSIERCAYTALGVAPFDIEELLSERSIVITDLRGREIDVRPRIYAVERNGEALNFTLGNGVNNLRPDLFASYLCDRYGGKATDIIKTAAFGKGVF
ncbi:MAG: TIGR03936 family radical SAM-associated protein [Clostridia bacterium]|nr:TIGR03936 family radical SAM-associated protein [Clostridia bacterium]